MAAVHTSGRCREVQLSTIVIGQGPRRCPPTIIDQSIDQSINRSARKMDGVGAKRTWFAVVVPANYHSAEGPPSFAVHRTNDAREAVNKQICEDARSW
jgi:hypothetical protein